MTGQGGKSHRCKNHGVGTHLYSADVDCDGVVDPGDAAIQALLAENTHDPKKSDWLVGAILTVPPLKEWPRECGEKLYETCQFIKGLAEALRHSGEIHDGGGD
jgi:hypothetical protein